MVDGPSAAVSLEVVDLDKTSDITAHAATLQASLDLAHGPLLRAALYRFGPGEPGRLLIVIHHLVVDGVSWRVLVEDLAAAYEQAGGAVRLPPKTSSFQAWADQLAAYAQSNALLDELPHWREAAQASASLPIDHPADPGANTVASQREVVVTLAPAATQALLTEVPKAYGTQISDALLAALGLALSVWSGELRQRIDTEGHGREGLFATLDVSRTVGWFTSIYPVALDMRGLEAPGALLASVKEQLRQTPHNGIGYGLLRHLGPEAARAELSDQRPAGVLFNYLGQFGVSATASLFATADEPHGPDFGPGNRRSHLLGVNGFIAEGRLSVSFSYSDRLHLPATIERLASAFMEALRGLIAHCRRPEAGGLTPADMPLARLSPARLDHVLATVGVPNTRAARERVEAIYPLSPLQQGLLVLCAQFPEQHLYFNQFSYLLHGDLRCRPLRAGLADGAGAPPHPAHRLCVGGARPAGAGGAARSAAAGERSWTGASCRRPRQHAGTAATFLEEDHRSGFDLRQAPLLRLTLIAPADRPRRLVWSYHHILLDGWSVPLLFNEILSLYDGLPARRGPGAPAAAALWRLYRLAPAAGAYGGGAGLARAAGRLRHT